MITRNGIVPLNLLQNHEIESVEFYGENPLIYRPAEGERDIHKR